MRVWTEIAAAIAQDGLAALVTLSEVRGSSPREVGTRMVVRRGGGFRGSIGGGALEHESLGAVLSLLTEGKVTGATRRQALGPDLGQCCGGQVAVTTEVFGAADLDWIAPLAAAEGAGNVLETSGQPDPAGRLIRRIGAKDGGGVRETFGVVRTPVLLFGAGHVGRAVALALAPLPFRLAWIDSRPDAFPERAPANAEMRHMADPAAVALAALPGSLALVMTHSHALDLSIVAAALGSGRFPYVGLIGSATKRARFESRLRQSGLTESQMQPLVCPVGGAGVRDKSPAAIAAVAAVELLTVRERIGGPAV